MKINKINFPQYLAPKEQKSSIKFKYELKNDTFEKSDVSFTGKDFYGMKPSRVTQKDIKKLGITNEMVSFAETFINILGLSSYRQECEAENYIDSFASNKQMRQMLNACKNETIEGFNTKYLCALIGNFDSVTKTMASAGIKTTRQLEGFLREYTSPLGTRKTFKGQVVEALNIYGLLQNKAHLSRYGELALYLYNVEADKKEPNFEKINEYAKFLEQISVQDMKSFEDKFAHLKPEFNDFKDTSDKADAIEWLINTYDEKIAHLQKATDNNESSAKKLYAQIPHVIDTQFKNNDEKSLGDIKNWIQAAQNSVNLKLSVQKTIAPVFNNFKTPKDSIEFYKFLTECGLNVKDISNLFSKDIISGQEPSDYLLEYSTYTECVENSGAIPKENLKETYIKFKGPINAILHDKTGEKSDNVLEFLNFTKRFNVQNAAQLLELYNKATGSKKRTITEEEFKSFFEIIKHAKSPEVLKEARAANKSAVAYLKEKEQKEKEYKTAIQAFTDNDKTGYFAGRTTDEIYGEYKNLFTTSEDIPSVLSNIADFGIQNSDEYKAKSDKINQFREFFDTGENLIKFVQQAKFKFDNTDSDNKYIESCKTVLSTVSTGDEKAEERKNYFINSKFFPNSKSTLAEFINSIPEEQRTDLFSVIADKKIKSTAEIDKFLKKYKDDNDNVQNLYKFIINLPDDVTFDDAKETLSAIQETLDNINVKIKIDNSNILNLSERLFTQRKRLTALRLNKMINDLNGAKDNNKLFISSLEGAYMKKDNTHSKYRIAREIANNANKSDESYQNLISALKLDKDRLGVADDASEYIYTRAIESALSDEFIDFVNSTEWLNYADDKTKLPNFTLHAKLRFIDRYAMGESRDIQTLYTKETTNRLKGILKSIYEKIPEEIDKNDKHGAIVIDTKVNDSRTEVVFSPEGKIITIVPKKA